MAIVRPPADMHPADPAGGSSLEPRLRAAIAADEIRMHYQPLVDLASGSAVAVEALARWEDPRLGTVPPDRFIPLAEHTGLIVDLGRNALRQACEVASSWSRSHERTLKVGVNVSPLELRETSFVDDVENTLAETGLPPDRLCLELTETAIVADVEAAARTLGRIRDLGVTLALDDFGTGHSSLTLLRRLPLNTVKIDRSLIRRVAVDASEAVLVQLVVDASHTLGMRVCAEGVESADQAEQLVAMGCDLGQGWLFGRPAAEPRTDLPRPRHGLAPDWQVSGAPPVALSGRTDLVVLADRVDRVTYVSGSSRSILGRSPSQLVGQTLQDLLGSQPAAGPVSLRIEHADRSHRWLRGTVQPLLDDDGELRETLCVLVDVTAAVAHEEALAVSEDLFRSAFSGAPIAIALSDFEGRLFRVNAAMCELLGYPAAELLRMTVSDITVPEDRAQDASNLAEIQSGGVSEHRIIKRYLHADGHAIPVEVHAAAVRASDGEPYCIVAHILEAHLWAGLRRDVRVQVGSPG